MLKIGELAKICNVSTQTLRFYDREGIFSPEEVDTESGYRYYGERQIETLKSIIRLKSLGFELSEIKEMLAADEGEKIRLYKKKINALNRKAGDFSDNIYEIRRLCRNEENARESNKDTMLQQFLDLKFENDEQAIGKWAFKGKCKAAAAEREALLAAENLEYDESYEHKTVFFLPGGASYWVFTWTKGVLYIYSAVLSRWVANEYKIFPHGEKVYMLVSRKAEDGSPYLVIYEKIDGKRYTDRGARVFCDNTDIPFIDDPEFKGKWKACALIDAERVADFSPEKKYEERELYLLSLDVCERGICFKEWLDCGRTYIHSMEYSKGVVINKRMEMVEHYTIKHFATENGTETYLFLEHKSGDYCYGGKIYFYYVFKKEV